MAVADFRVDGRQFFIGRGQQLRYCDEKGNEVAVQPSERTFHAFTSLRASVSASGNAELELLSLSSYYRRMTTLSPTRARANLTSLLKRAANGEDIGILHGDKIIALRPVTVHSDDYALQEYGVTEKELDRFVMRMDKRIA